MPEDFRPRPYQTYAIKRIEETPALALMLDMGMGKTVATLTAIQSLLYDSFEVQKVLVIAPLHVAETTWADECSTWNHLKDMRVEPVLGNLRKRVAALKRRADVYTINRENVVWLVQYYGKDWPFDMVVIDESSSFKNPQAKRFRALRKVRAKIHRLVELTGTPAPNGLMDLWSQLYLLDRGVRLGTTIGEYRRRWFKPGASRDFVVYDWLPVTGAKEEIYKAIGDICISMKSEDYISLPPVIYKTTRVELPDKAAAEYRQLEKDLIIPLEDTEIVAPTAAVLSNKLLQMANGCVYDTDGGTQEFHTAKLEALAEIIEANNGKPVMVFYWFKHDLVRLKAKFKDAEILNGRESIQRWNSGEIKILLAHPASAGHGLNLQRGGNVAVWYSLTWSLELYQQANKRLHRSGQRNTVVIHHLVAKGTIDEAALKSLKNKKVGQDGMLEAIKARIREYKGKFLK